MAYLKARNMFILFYFILSCFILFFSMAPAVSVQTPAKFNILNIAFQASTLMKIDTNKYMSIDR